MKYLGDRQLTDVFGSGVRACARAATVNLAAAIAVVVGAHVPMASADDSAAQGLQEVVVTAQKRPETTMEVPSSLTVLSSETLINEGATNFTDYMTLVPGLELNSGGSVGHGLMIMRGLNTGSGQLTGTVGYYVDDTPFSANSSVAFQNFASPDVDLADVDHIEVLKGPQATLYGASTLGGLIKTVMKQPDLQTDGGQVRLQGMHAQDGGSGYGMSGAVNMVVDPDHLAIRISGFKREDPGYMTNAYLGTTDRGGNYSDGARISVRWAPTENFDASLMWFWQEQKTSGWNYEFVDQFTVKPTIADYNYSTLFDARYLTTYSIYALTLNYKVGSIGTLTSSTSYARYVDQELQDWTQYLGPYNDFSPVPVPPPPNSAIGVVQNPEVGKFTQEVRFATQRMGAFEGMLGLFYTNEQVTPYFPVLNVDPKTLQPLPEPVGTIFGASVNSRYKEEAAFANLTYYFTDAVDLTLGGRYSHNSQDSNACTWGFAAPGGCIPTDLSDNDFTYLTALRWRPAPNIDTYARVATSYRPGGPQALPVPGAPETYNHDTLTNYEIGLKGQWLDHRLESSLALYDMEWKNIQLQQLVQGIAVTLNGGEARIQGAELELKYAPLPPLTLGAAVTYTDPKLTSVSPGVTEAIGAVSGDLLPFTPKWAGAATVDYTQTLSDDVALVYGLTYAYQGKRISGFPGADANPGVWIPSYQTLDFRTGVHWGTQRRYEVQARVANLTNEHGYSSLVNWRLGSFVSPNPPSWAATIPPRTYVLSVSAKF